MRWLVLALVALVVVLSAGAWRIVGARDYDGLRHGSFSRVRGERTGADPWRLRYREGRAFTIGMSLRNDGGRGVSISDVGASGGVLSKVGARMATRVTADPPRRLAPFRSFDLGAGKERYVQVTMLMGPCDRRRGDSIVIRTLPVAFHVDFFDLDADVRLATPVRLIGCAG